MELTQQNVSAFIEAIASKEPAPGGGAVSALMGALGAALCEMVANLTIGRQKYSAYWENAQRVRENAQTHKEELIAAVERDTAAYLRVSAAYALPKETDAQKEARKDAIQQGLREATEAPFETMRLSLSAMQLAKSLLGYSNENAASDLGVAALSLVAAVKGAWLNVLINIGSLDDAQLAAEYRSKGDFLVSEAEIAANELYVGVRAKL